MPPPDRERRDARPAGSRPKYAREERERRWLVRRLPDLGRFGQARRIDDRYLAGTTLRLRRVTDPDGARAPRFKLGQKLRPDPSDPATVMCTSIYLGEDEHARLSALPAAGLSKVRHTVQLASDRFALDVFRGRHRGLALLEVELREGDEPEPPEFAGAEVTGEECFSGGWLAFASPPELNRLLLSSGIITDA